MRRIQPGPERHEQDQRGHRGFNGPGLRGHDKRLQPVVSGLGRAASAMLVCDQIGDAGEYLQ